MPTNYIITEDTKGQKTITPLSLQQGTNIAVATNASKLTEEEIEAIAGYILDLLENSSLEEAKAALKQPADELVAGLAKFTGAAIAEKYE